MCAGIDPIAAGVEAGDGGFPRVCGDRPAWIGMVAEAMEVPPCVRG